MVSLTWQCSCWTTASQAQGLHHSGTGKRFYIWFCSLSLQICVCVHPLWRQHRCTSSPPNSLCTAWSGAGSTPNSFVRAGAGGSQVLKGYKIQAWLLPHVVICLGLILLNIAEVFILIFLSQALFYFTKVKVCFFNERHFSSGFWEIVFFCLLISNGKKKSKAIQLTFGSHPLSELASFDETESIIAEKLTVQLLILPWLFVRGHMLFIL